MKAPAAERDTGFTLIETITSVVVIGIVMMALTGFFVTTVATVNAQGSVQAATSLAESAIARVRSLTGSALLSGRDPVSALAQWQAPAPGAAAYLTDTSQVADTTALTNAGLTAALPTTPLPVLVNSISYQQNFYVGTCRQPVGGGDCTASLATGVPFYRVVVAVTWPGRNCSSARCSYVTATLVSSAPGDPVFNPSQVAKRPQVVNPGNQAGTISSLVKLPLTATGGAQPLTWTFTGLPPGLAWDGVLINGTLPATVGTYTVTVTVKDKFNAISTAAFTWTVYTTPAILASTRVEVWLDSSDTTRVLTAGGSPAAATARVATINDRSGNNRNVTQPTVANQMTVGTLNGHQAVASTATTWFTSALTGTFRTVVAVAAPSLTATLPQTIFASPANTDSSLRLTGPRVGINATGYVNTEDWSYGGQSWTNDVAAVAPLPTAPAIYVAERPTAVSGKTFSLSSSFVSRGVVGAIGEVIVFNSTLTAAERRTVEDYLAVKWSVTMIPDVPTAVSVAPADSTAVVSWTAPASTGNSPIAGYSVTATPTGTGLPAVSCTSAATPTRCSLNGLVNGTTYTVTVSAINAVGEGSESAGTSFVFPSALLTAANLTTWLDASATDKVLTSGGVAATTGQSVQTWKDRSGNNRNGAQSTAAYQMTVGTLNGRQALISTANTRYDGTLTGDFRTIIAVGAPNTSLPYSTTFAAPANLDNASQRIVNGYLPTIGGPYPTNINDWSYNTGTPTHVWVNSLASPGTIISPGIFVSESVSTKTNSTFSVSTGFTNAGSTRGFNGPLGEVIAFNRVLTSTERRQVEEYLARKWFISITPQAPTVVSVTKPVSKSLTVSWDPPAWDGDSAVTGYTATATAGKSCTAAAGVSSCTIIGLIAGTTYPVTMTATNAAGAGAASAAVNGTA